MICYKHVYTYKEVQNNGLTAHTTHTVQSDRTQLLDNKLSSHSSFLSLKTLSLLQVTSRTPCMFFVWIRRVSLIYTSQVEFHNTYKANITIQSNEVLHMCIAKQSYFLENYIPMFLEVINISPSFACLHQARYSNSSHNS